MLKNYIKIAWRNYRRDKSFSLINTVGLAVALCAFLLIALFVLDELSYDRYHPDANRLYRITKSFEKDELKTKSLSTSNLLAPTLKEEIPGIEEAFRISSRFSGSLVESDQQKGFEDHLYVADASLLSAFSYQFLKGNSKNAFINPFSAVVTESTAQKYFRNEDPIGKILSITFFWGEEYDVEITALVEDTPSNSHFRFDLLLPMEFYKAITPWPENDFESWGHVGSYTYIKLSEGIAPQDVEDQFPAFLNRHQGEGAQYDSMFLQPVNDIHLYSDFDRELQPNSDVRYLYIFSSVAFLILIIAGINYVNLATAKSADRAKEVGIRKTLGSDRLQIFQQFLMESFLLCTISILLALLLTELVLPFFNNLTDKSLQIPFNTFQFIGLLILFVGGFSLLSGIYPAAMLSKFLPGRVLKGENSGRKKSMLRYGLIVFQFSVSIMLIVSTLIISQQLDFVQNKRLGYTEDEVVIVEAKNGLSDKFDVFKDELKRNPSVIGITYTGASSLPVPNNTEVGMYISPSEGEPDNNNLLAIGDDFLDVMSIELITGHTLDRYTTAELRNLDYYPVLINETAVNEFGWEEEPIGKTFQGFTPTPTVVGVVSDFHYQSLKTKIQPLILMRLSGPRNVMVRVKTDDIQQTLNDIKEVWEKVGPGTPFVYSFLDENYKNLYLAEDKLATLFNYFTTLAIIIACLGLFGLSAFTAQRRTKEIGIRKVLGASVTNIVSLLSKDFILLVSISFVIAVPISWYAMNQWLTDFAYRIEIGPGIFVFAGLTALTIALLTVSWQSIRAALANPVDSLRSE